MKKKWIYSGLAVCVAGACLSGCASLESGGAVFFFHFAPPARGPGLGLGGGGSL